MIKHKIIIEEQAKKDLQKQFKSGDKVTIARIKKILKELSEHPFSGTGHPEALKHKYSGFWSRQINKKDRIIYHVDDDKLIVIIISMKGHYNDK